MSLSPNRYQATVGRPLLGRLLVDLRVVAMSTIIPPAGLPPPPPPALPIHLRPRRSPPPATFVTQKCMIL